jgi:predicted CXXCH cytochrome family protein
MSSHRRLAILGLVVVSFGLASCADEESVFEQPSQFDQPPTAALGFLGYGDRVAKVTVCGDCHESRQGTWSQTAHAGAWQTMRSSEARQSYCESCHAVSELGNAIEGVDVGWTATSDPRYYDVQCESCHGGGLDHVVNTAEVKPLAHIGILGSAGKTAAFESCGECHQSAHAPFVDEWVQSAHAEANSTVQNLASGDPDRYGACLDCHTGQGALAAWGVDSDYVEKDDAIVDQVGIVCAVCHDPHQSTHAGQLRYAIDVLDGAANLCMRCHDRNATPNPSSSRGPHAAAGPLLRGEAGWFPPGFPFEPGELVPTHGSAENPRLCAGCHVNGATVTLPSGSPYNGAGHQFTAITCLDENGLPVPGDCDLADRDFSFCASCHSGEANARLLWTQSNQQIADAVATLQGLLDQVPSIEFDTGDGEITVAEGADFNRQLALTGGAVAHNGPLVKFLLLASIDRVKAQYGLN